MISTVLLILGLVGQTLRTPHDWQDWRAFHDQMDINRWIIDGGYPTWKAQQDALQMDQVMQGMAIEQERYARQQKRLADVKIRRKARTVRLPGVGGHAPPPLMSKEEREAQIQRNLDKNHSK